MRKVLLALLLLYPYFITASTMDAADLLKQRLKEIKSYQASFKQKVTSSRKLIQQNRGEVILLRPGKFFWKTNSPMPQLIVSNGKTLWIFDKDLEQVTIKSLQGNMDRTPAQFLSGQDTNIAKDYTISIKYKKGVQQYTLIPKDNKDNYQRIELMYRQNKLVGMMIKDHLGQKTHLSFSNIRLNPVVSQRIFNFIPPSGVDIIKQ